MDPGEVATVPGFVLMLSPTACLFKGGCGNLSDWFGGRVFAVSVDEDVDVGGRPNFGRLMGAANEFG